MMMQGIRKAGQTWLGKTIVFVLFGFLIFSFAIWGIGDIFRGAINTSVAKVGSRDITIEEVRNAFQTELQRQSRRLRQNVTAAQARAVGLDRQILEQLINQAAIDADAQAKGIAIDDQTAAQAILDDPSFRGPTGFNRFAFNELLRQAGLTEAGYIAEQRRTLARTQLSEGVAGGASPPLAMQIAAHRYRNERRVIRHFVLPEAQAGTIADPAEDALKAFYEERKASFRAPEYRTASVLALTPAALAKPDAVSEADAQAHYEQIKLERFGTPERRTIQQIVFPNAEEAAAALARIRSGTSFADIAAERRVSSADLTLGTMTRNELFDAKVAEAAFALPQGQVSEVVEGNFGPVLLHVPAIEPARIRPFAEVAAEVRAELARERATREMTTVHDRIEDQRVSGRPLGEIAAELNLGAVKVGPIDARLGLPADAIPPSVPQLEQVVAAMFRSDIGADNEPLRMPDGGYIWYDVTAVDPPRERGFDEVRTELAAQWRADQVAAALQTRARELTDRIAQGTTFEAAAAEAGATAAVSQPFGRATQQAEIPPNVVVLAFGTPVNGIASAGLADGQGRMIFRVESATVPPFVRSTQEADNVAQQLASTLSDDLLGQYIASLRAQLGVSINETAFRDATGAGEF